VKSKLDDLARLYDVIKNDTTCRSATLEQTLQVLEMFWDNLNSLAGTVKELQDTLANQEPPAIHLEAIREQQDTLEVSEGCLLNHSSI
jgi:hypothetical protein